MREILRDIANLEERLRRCDAGKILRQRADRRRDRHIVIVQNDDKALVHGAGVVHGLVGHACAHRSVADDGDHMPAVVGVQEIAHNRHTEPS